MLNNCQSIFKWFRKTDNRPLSMRRRLKFTSVVLVSQMLLIALAITWLVHMVIIAVNGSIYFVERNPYILWAEVAATVIIILFALYVFATQIRRLGERRRDDDRRSGGRE